MTIRARVTGLATLAVLVVLVISGWLVVEQQRRLLLESLDDGLLERAEELADQGRSVDGPITALTDDDDLVQVVFDGSVVASSESGAGVAPIAAPPEGDDEIVRTVSELPHEDGRFRVASVGFADGGGAGAVHVAGSMDDIDEAASTLTRSLLVAVPLAVVALGLVIWWFVGRTLRPVEDIRSEVAGIGGRDLARRVPVPGGGDEITRLAETMNDMLDRLEDAARRQQRFLADASHELRSPLTRVRTELEVDLAHGEGADLRATHRSVLEETIGLQRLAEDLLLVARSDAGGGRPGVQQRVDLADVARRAASRAANGRDLQVDVTGLQETTAEGDPEMLQRCVTNLVENALRHAATSVAISVDAEGEQAVLAVIDDGPGVPEAERERIFERFARVDGARSAADGGAGLGLAIARDIAERHGGSLTLEASSTGARFVLRLPLAG